MADENGSTPSKELEVVKYITCEMIQCEATAIDVAPLAPNSPEYIAKIERLYALYPKRMLVIADTINEAVANGTYVPFLYSELDRLMDYDAGIEPAYPEELLPGAGFAKKGMRLTVSAIVQIAERLATIKSAKSSVGHYNFAGLSTVESGIVHEAKSMLNSSEFSKIRQAYDMKQSVSIKIDGKIIQYEPNLPSSGMTMFGENGFLIGSEAFKTTTELEKTLLHELHRLKTTSSSSGLSAELAAQETKEAFNFAEKAHQFLKTDN